MCDYDSQIVLFEEKHVCQFDDLVWPQLHSFGWFSAIDLATVCLHHFLLEREPQSR